MTRYAQMKDGEQTFEDMHPGIVYNVLVCRVTHDGGSPVTSGLRFWTSATTSFDSFRERCEKRVCLPTVAPRGSLYWVRNNNDVTWTSWPLKSPATPMFVQHFVMSIIKVNIKAPLLWWESTGDWWARKGPVTRKAFPLHDVIMALRYSVTMTSWFGNAFLIAGTFCGPLSLETRVLILKNTNYFLFY